MRNFFRTVVVFFLMAGAAVKPALAACVNPADVETALGCINPSPETLVTFLVTTATRLAGGISLALLTYGGVKYITSRGDWEAVDDAKATITQALTGLMLILFSVLLLRVIGYDILRLPGWGVSGGQLQMPQ